MTDELGEQSDPCMFNASTQEETVKKKKKIGHKCCAAAMCNNRSDNRPDLSFHEFPSDKQRRKTWEIRMRRQDAYFATVKNKFCCSEHFLSTDFKSSLTGHRRSLTPGAVPSVFPWSKEPDEKSLLRAERLKCRREAPVVAKSGAIKQQKVEIKDEGNDFVAFGPPTLDDWEEIKKENERLLQE